jgi:hypothetical protein
MCVGGSRLCWLPLALLLLLLPASGLLGEEATTAELIEEALSLLDSWERRLVERERLLTEREATLASLEGRLIEIEASLTLTERLALDCGRSLRSCESANARLRVVAGVFAGTTAALLLVLILR